MTPFSRFQFGSLANLSRCIQFAWDAGINNFDTANVYSNGESERILGVFLKKHEIPREEVVILTKVKGVVLALEL